MADLRKLAREIAKLEGKKTNLSIAQITEVLGALGKRWRALTPEAALREAAAIIERAGKR